MQIVEASEVLRRLGACEGEDGAIPWVIERSRRVAPELRTGCAAYEECERGDWLIWLITRPQIAPAVGGRALRLIACDCAERVLPIYERDYPGDTRPRHAIEVARRYAIGAASERDRAAAWAAAWAAAGAAARDAAWAAAGVAAGAAEIRAQADIVRRHVPWPVLRDALAAYWRGEEVRGG